MVPLLLIASHENLIRAGLSALMHSEKQAEVIGEASNSDDALRLARELKPDILMVDLGMPPDGGLEAIRQLRDEYPDTRVLAVAPAKDRRMLEAFRAGARGFLPRCADLDDLSKAIKAMTRGERYVHPLVVETLLQDSIESPAAPTHGPEDLTPREIEVLRLIAEGHTTPEIADLLCISPRTVEFHRGNIVSKLELRSRAELVRFAIARGLVGSLQPYKRS